MGDKLVSVCINSYNSAKYILDTINSVINQTYKNLQIIVLDDCSTDNTVELINSINDDRIEIHLTQKNSYITFAYNESLKYVKGDYIARLDADDLWEKDKIEKQVKFLEEHTEYGACFTHVTVIDVNGNPNGENLQDLRNIFNFENCPQAEMYRYFYDNSNRLCHSSSLIKTSVMKEVGMYDVSTFNVHDFDYWMRLITYYPLYIITEPLTRYRSGGASGNMPLEKIVAQNTELARITYKSIQLCPDDLFLKAFDDKLQFSGEHTHDEVEIEKAFLLLEGPISYKGNPVLGIYKFVKLFEDEKYITLADQKFNFTLKDFYKLQGNKSYFNIGDETHLVNSLNNANLELANCKEYISKLENHNQDLEEYRDDLEKYRDDLEKYRDDLEEHCRNLQDYCRNLEKYNQDLENNNQDQDDYIKSLELQRDELTAKLNILQNDYSNIKNMFAIKVILFIKRLFKH